MSIEDEKLAAEQLPYHFDENWARRMPMPKRYLLFGFDTHYPAGGWNDYIGDFADIDTARENRCRDNYQIVDADTMTTVESGKV